MQSFKACSKEASRIDFKSHTLSIFIFIHPDNGSEIETLHDTLLILPRPSPPFSLPFVLSAFLFDGQFVRKWIAWDVISLETNLPNIYRKL